MPEKKIHIRFELNPGNIDDAKLIKKIETFKKKNGIKTTLGAVRKMI